MSNRLLLKLLMKWREVSNARQKCFCMGVSVTFIQIADFGCSSAISLMERLGRSLQGAIFMRGSIKTDGAALLVAATGTGQEELPDLE